MNIQDIQLISNVTNPKAEIQKKIPGKHSFEDAMLKAINNVSSLQGNADEKIKSFLKGDPIDLHNIMISLESANINFRLITEIRNKALTAYEELMKMPL